MNSLKINKKPKRKSYFDAIITPPVNQTGPVSRVPSKPEVQILLSRKVNAYWGESTPTKARWKHSKKDLIGDYKASIRVSVLQNLNSFNDMVQVGNITKALFDRDVTVRNKTKKLEKFTEEEQLLLLDNARIKYAQTVIAKENYYDVNHVARQKFELSRFLIRGRVLARNHLSAISLLKTITDDNRIDIVFRDTARLWIHAIKEAIPKK